MNKDRLLRLADLLEAHKDNGVRFSLADWVVSNDEDGDWCGTTACAVGLACLDPQFKKEGLSYVFGGPRFEHYHSWDAVKEFFGLPSHSQAEYLFSMYSYEADHKTPASEVAKRIRAVVSDGFPGDQVIDRALEEARNQRHS